MSKYVLKIPMNEKEKASFLKAHVRSGFSTMSEFVRFVLRKYVESEKKNG